MKHAFSLLVTVVFTLSADGLSAVADDLSITGHAQPGLEPFDKVMTTFLADHHILGGALGVTRNGKLVYARGFGWADREGHDPVVPSSLFQIASISKPITVVAILTLVEQGKLKLDDHASPSC